MQLSVKPKEIITKLENGESVSCPDCGEMIVPKKKDGDKFYCEKCGFLIHIDKIK